MKLNSGISVKVCTKLNSGLVLRVIRGDVRKKSHKIKPTGICS